MSQIYNRQTKTYTENSQYGGGLLNVLYNKPLGRCLLKFVIHPVFSEIGGMYHRSPLSRKKVASFVKEYNINLDDFEKKEYTSFDDFFIRRIKPGKRPVDKREDCLIAPADSKLSVYPIGKENRIEIKGVSYTVSELLGGKGELGNFQGGTCLVFRLAMDDYHRYCFVDDGRVKKRYTIKGRLHTVSSISKEHKIYRENTRVVNLMQIANFGNVICIEVGALLVGKIRNYKIRTFLKGQEKGYFELGGSTIVYLIKPGKVKLDEDIVANVNEDTEIKVLMGEKIGRKI